MLDTVSGCEKGEGVRDVEKKTTLPVYSRVDARLTPVHEHAVCEDRYVTCVGNEEANPLIVLSQ